MNSEDKISIKIGGSVGIAIYPNEYDKKQILKTIHSYDYENIIYFGDKYIDLPVKFNDMVKKYQGHKSVSNNKFLGILPKYFNNLKNKYGYGKLGGYNNLKNKCIN